MNDVHVVRDLLQSFGWRRDGFRVLTDSQATRTAILDGFRWLAAGARPGDVRREDLVVQTEAATSPSSSGMDSPDLNTFFFGVARYTTPSPNTTRSQAKAKGGSCST